MGTERCAPHDRRDSLKIYGLGRVLCGVAAIVLSARTTGSSDARLRHRMDWPRTFNILIF